MCLTTRNLPQQSQKFYLNKQAQGMTEITRNFNFKTTLQVARALESHVSTPLTEMLNDNGSQNRPIFSLNSQVNKNVRVEVANHAKSYMKEQYATLQNPRTYGLQGSFRATATLDQFPDQQSIRDRQINRADVTSIISRPELKSTKRGKLLSPVRQAPKGISMGS